jgi:hypothetical protein
VSRAGAEFTALVDCQAKLAAHYALNYVPFAILLDETGAVVRGPSLVDVSKDKDRADITAWIKTGELPPGSADDAKQPPGAFAIAEAELRFSRASLLFDRGQTEEATKQLRRALELDPGNWIIRKQIWAVEHPERFYDRRVDFGWQRQQMQQGK